MRKNDPKSSAIADALIAGALFDFMGFLTTSETRYKFSAYDEASPAVRALKEWSEKRGLSLDEAQVANWRDTRSQIVDLEAKLAAAEERTIKAVETIRNEAVELCRDLHHTWRWDYEPDSENGPRQCAAAIQGIDTAAIIAGVKS